MRSLLWLAIAGAYWTAQKLDTFTNMLLVCASCNKSSETVACALVECRLVNTSRNRKHGVMLIRFGQRLNTTSTLTLQMRQWPK
jgi:hypothetical protein